MKTNTKLIALIVLSTALISSAFAGSWTHAVYSGSFNDTPYVPSAATVQQIIQAFGPYGSTAVNSGPLGWFSCNSPSPQLVYTGNIAGGTNVYVYQVVLGSGYSVTTINW